MKFATLSLFTALAAASPISPAAQLSDNEINVSDNELELQARQFGLGSNTSNDVQNGRAGACPKAIFIFARASTETGNMVGCAIPVFTHERLTQTRALPLVPPSPVPSSATMARATSGFKELVAPTVPTWARTHYPEVHLKQP